MFRRQRQDDALTTRFGTLSYKAPEIVKRILKVEKERTRDVEFEFDEIYNNKCKLFPQSVFDILMVHVLDLYQLDHTVILVLLFVLYKYTGPISIHFQNFE